MREFQEKHKYKKIVYSKVMVVLLALLIVFFARATWGVYKKEQESSANTYRAAQELKRLSDREELLKREIARLSTDQGIEEEIRAKYGVSKPGEEILIIVDPNSATTTEVLDNPTLWERFKKLFK